MKFVQWIKARPFLKCVLDLIVVSLVIFDAVYLGASYVLYQAGLL